MKILKITDTSKWSYKFTCSQCDSQLEAERGDVKYNFHSGYGREEDYCTWQVTCPICQCIKNIPENEIPKALQTQIKNNKFPNPGTSYVDLDDGKQHPWDKRD